MNNQQPYPDRNPTTTATGDDEVLAAVPPLIDDIAQLVREITRLRDALISERLASANRLAAIRAALGAAADGEADPLAYLRDELPGNSGGPYGA